MQTLHALFANQNEKLFSKSIQTTPRSKFWQKIESIILKIFGEKKYQKFVENAFTEKKYTTYIQKQDLKHLKVAFSSKIFPFSWQQYEKMLKDAENKPEIFSFLVQNFPSYLQKKELASTVSFYFQNLMIDLTLPKKTIETFSFLPDALKQEMKQKFIEILLSLDGQQHIAYFTSFYPEVNWFFEPKATVGGIEENAKSEGRKTILSFICLTFLLKNSYDEFVTPQDLKKVLQKNEFEKIVALFSKEEKEVQKLLALLAIHDTGKIHELQKKVNQNEQGKIFNHDEVIEKGIRKFPGLFPSFEYLSKEQQEEVEAVLKVDFLFAQKIQGEDVARTLEEFIALRPSERKLLLQFALLDLMGAFVPLDSHTKDPLYNGSITFHSGTYQKFYAFLQAVETILKEDEIPEKDRKQVAIMIQEQFIKNMFQVYGKFGQLNQEQKTAAARICLSLRLSTSEDVKIVEEGIRSLTKGEKTSLAQFLNQTGYDSIAIILEYMPAILIAFKDKEFSKESMTKACQFILKLFKFAKPHLPKDQKEGVVRFLCDEVVREIKSHTIEEIEKMEWEVKGKYGEETLRIVPKKA